MAERTADALFRKLALALPGAEEKSHFEKADFRVGNKIFAGFGREAVAYVKLTPEQQEMVCAAEPAAVTPIPGGWGRQGWTSVDQTRAGADLMQSLLRMAWANVAPKTVQKGPESGQK